MSDIDYPRTERIDVVEEHFDQTIVDPYRWLENSASQDANVVTWIKAQNDLTRACLETLPGRDVFRKRMGELLDYDRYTAPLKRGSHYFYTLHEGPVNQPSLYMRDHVDGENRLLIDPNAWSNDGADALAEWQVSDDGKLIVFGIQTGGEDWRKLKVLDVETGNVLDDEVQWARFTKIAWAPDGSGFFYSQFPEPEAGKAAVAGVANQAVYFHQLGMPQRDDRLIYATPDRPHLLHMADRVVNGRYLHIISTPGSNENALTVVDLDARDWTPRTIIADLESEWTVIGEDETRLVVITTHGAERRRLVSLDLAQAEPHPVEILAEAQDDAVLNDAAILGGRLLIAYLVDAKTEIRRFTLDGGQDGIVALPGLGSAGGLRGDSQEDEAFFVFTSFDAPTAIYRYDVGTGRVTPWAKPHVPVDLERFVVEQRFYRSKDGTEVPIFIMRRKDSTSAAPTLLYGYGGFGISQIPYYNPLQLAWVEQGGVLAVANIRGGGEYGRAWHRAGKRENKQNAFDDFIAAGAFLKQAAITTPDGLAIQGESGGGLLVGAVTNQRPDLFDVSLPGVGVMDMLRYDKFTGGILWSGEFGSPAEETHFHNLMRYSPYHGIKHGQNYPAILATTADADDRVVPAHTFKYVAALQAAELGPNPHLVRIETRAGHGAGMPMDKVVAQHADMWAFAAKWTGLEIRPIR